MHSPNCEDLGYMEGNADNSNKLVFISEDFLYYTDDEISYIFT